MMTPSANVSVTAPVNPAIEHVKNVLFRPFDIGKWFIIGFCAWLASLGIEDILGAGSNYSGGIHPENGGIPGQLQHAKDYVMDNLSRIVPLAIVLAVAGLVVWVVFTWLNSRGRFMLLHCVALNRAEVSGPWNKFARAGNSLFKFQLVLGLIGMALILPLLIWAGVLIYAMIGHGEPALGSIFVVSAVVLAFLIVAMILSLIMMFTNDFVVPLMFLRDGTCLEGWRELRGLMAGNLDLFVLYVLFQIVLGLALLLLILVCIVITCCIARYLLAIPYLGSVALLPVTVFRRSYSALYLAQFGPHYNVFPVSTPPPLPM